MRRWGAEKVSVKAAIDGRTLERHRNKSTNGYELDGQAYVAFAANPPDVVQAFANVDETNFQTQRDNTFWFTASPPEVGRKLDLIVELGAIDCVLTRLDKRARESKLRAKVADEQLAAAKTAAKEYRWVGVAADAYGGLDGLHTKACEARGAADKARTAYDLCSNAAGVHLGLVGVLGYQQKVLAAAKAALQARQKADKARGLLGQIVQARHNRGLTIPDFGPVAAAYAADQAAQAKATNARNLMAGLAAAETNLTEANHLLALAMSDLEEQTKAFKLCPTCGQPLPGPQ